nr:MAG TPA: hypothetical protein [Caudoviricetes sp.]
MCLKIFIIFNLSVNILLSLFTTRNSITFSIFNSSIFKLF